MRRTLVGLFCIFLAPLFLSTCTGAPAEVDLGQEFLLPIGQEAVVAGEDLRIRFEDVIEDSRCPLNVTCIWEGRATILVQLTHDNEVYKLELNEPGLTDNAMDTFLEYNLTFHLKPYPGEVENTSKEDYFLQMTVSKQENPSFSTEDRAEIYSAVIRQLYEVDHTFGEPPNFPVVYIVYKTADSIGDPDAPKSESKELSPALRDVITEKLADLPAELKWVPDRDEVPLERDGGVQGGGAIVTLGNIHTGENNSALVSASLYIASLAATGKTYILEKQTEGWQVMGDTGVQWIS